MNKRRVTILAILAMGPLLLFQNCGQPFNVSKTALNAAAGTGSLSPSSPLVGQITTNDPVVPTQPILVPGVDPVPQPGPTAPIVVAPPSPQPSVPPTLPPVPVEPPIVVIPPSPEPGPTAPPVPVPVPGVCEIQDDHGDWKAIGWAHVKKSDFDRENNRKASSSNSVQNDRDEGEFMVPTNLAEDDDDVVCMSIVACNGVIVGHLAETDGVLLANKAALHKPLPVQAVAPLVRFRHGPNICNRGRGHRHHLNDDDVSNEVNRLNQYWQGRQ